MYTEHKNQQVTVFFVLPGKEAITLSEYLVQMELAAFERKEVNIGSFNCSTWEGTNHPPPT